MLWDLCVHLHEAAEMNISVHSERGSNLPRGSVQAGSAGPTAGCLRQPWGVTPRRHSLSLSVTSWHSLSREQGLKLRFRCAAWCVCGLSCVWHFCAPPGLTPLSTGFFQARILEWFVISYSRGSSQLRDWTWSPVVAGRFFTTEPPGKPNCRS